MKRFVSGHSSPSTLYGWVIHVLLLALPLFLCLHGHPAKSHAGSMEVHPDKELMRLHIEALAAIDPSRSANHPTSLDKAASYVLAEFEKTGCRTEIQSFTHKDRVYRNVICSFGPQGGERLVVGAHYDVHGDQPGADDNGSGVAGLLELARLMGTLKPELTRRTDFVAFTLEEPEFFRTRHMGSYVYAKSLAHAKVEVRAMIALEMIGYFSDAPGSQKYPLFFLKWFYPDKADYIAVVGKWGQGDLVDRVKKHILSAARINVESLAAPSILPGIDFSDHQSFWRFGYNAVMITDTAFYRNPNYHQPTDTIDTLDFDKMSEVVKGLYWTIINL